MDPTFLVHRALVALRLSAVQKRPSKTPRAVFARCGSTHALGSPGAHELVVVTDDEQLTGVALSAWLSAVATSLTPDGALALMVSSEPALALIAHARTRTSRVSGTDAFGKALTWAAAQPSGEEAPRLSPERLFAFAESAATADLELAEPDVTDLVPGLLPLRESLRAPVQRAVMTTIALGQVSRTLLFARRSPATKSAMQLRVERISTFWVKRRGRCPHDSVGLAATAFEVLESRAGALSFKELLRATRERDGESARRRGERPAVSTDDGAQLAKALGAAWLAGTIDLFAASPDTKFANDGEQL